MAKDQRRKSAQGRNKVEVPQAEAPVILNNPFLVHKRQLQGLVKPPPPVKPAVKPVKPLGKPPITSSAQNTPAAPANPRPGPAPPHPPKQISDEEIFQREMWGVRPLQVDRVRVTAEPDGIPPPRNRLSEEAEVYAQLADLVDGSGPWDIADTDEYIEGIGPGLDRRLLVRLRKGDYALQGHLDLHGLTSEEAHGKVDRFIQSSRAAGQRCVLIIHGKGINSKDQIPVLKERVRVWLTRGKIARSVLCFATARPTDGGTGAVYVLLRK